MENLLYGCEKNLQTYQLDSNILQIPKDFKSAYQKLHSFVQELIEKEELDEDGKAFLRNEENVFRFFRGWKYDNNQSFKQLKRTVEWRSKFAPSKLRIEDLSFLENLSPIVYFYEYDKEGHPIIWIHLNNIDQIRDNDEGEKKILLLVYWIENTLYKYIPKGKTRISLVIDMSGIGFSWIGTVSKFGSAFQKIGDYYCSILKRALCVNCGFFVRSIYGVASKFMGKNTKRKYMVNKGVEILKEYIDEDKIPACFSGKSKFVYNYKENVAFEKKKRESETK